MYMRNLGAKMATPRHIKYLAEMLILFGLHVHAVYAQQTTHKLTIEQIVAIKHPSEPIWSPDGNHIAFVWDQGGIENLYVANAGGNAPSVALTSFSEGQISRAFWSRDSQVIYFPRGGDLWKFRPSGGQPSAVWTTPTLESDIVPSPDG